MMKIMIKGRSDGRITRYFRNSLPELAVKGMDMNTIVGLLAGSKDYRYGPKPPYDVLRNVMKVVEDSIQISAPIPVFLPWGGRKMDPNLSIDVAEISALKQIERVDKAVREIYEPGLILHLRMEDVGAEWLYKTDEGINEYCTSITNLTQVMFGNLNIVSVRESEILDKNKYIQTAESYAELIDEILRVLEVAPKVSVEDIPEWRELHRRGWKGVFPEEQRRYYLDRYKRLYPNDSIEVHINKLSDYFAGSKTTHELGGKDIPNNPVGSHIGINFSNPVPGTPTGMFSNTLYYRTVPLSSGRTHCPPWRAKGYLYLEDDASAKISNISDKRELEMEEVEISDGRLSVSVRADYNEPMYESLIMSGMGMIP